MKIILSLFALSLSIAAAAATTVNLEQLQGAWWSDFKNPTADFAIHGNQVWLDYDSNYHSCRIEGDILIFELEEGLAPVKNRIIRLNGNLLTLEHLESKQSRVLRREASGMMPPGTE